MRAWSAVGRVVRRTSPEHGVDAHLEGAEGSLEMMPGFPGLVLGDPDEEEPQRFWRFLLGLLRVPDDDEAYVAPWGPDASRGDPDCVPESCLAAPRPQGQLGTESPLPRLVCPCQPPG